MKGGILAKALIAGIAGLAGMFSDATFDRSSWNFRGGTPSKRSRYGSRKPNKPGSSKDPHGGKFCKASPHGSVSPHGGWLSSRPSWKHPHALCANPAPPLRPGYAARDRRVRSIMSTTQPHDAAERAAIAQFSARPYPRKAEARSMYAGTLGNHPGMGKRMRASIAAGKQVLSTVKLARKLGVTL